jgi:uncharacterized protein with HEPN domain
MHSERDRAALQDIVFHCDLASAFVADSTLQDFQADLKTFYAATRCLEIISEASRRLSDDFKQQLPDIPWRNIAGSGNIYRHDYEDVLHRMVWATIKDALPPLRTTLAHELEV